MFFSAFGLQTAAAVGLDDAVRMARRERPDVVLCDYDLLAMLPLDAWEHDELLARTPVVAVSLARRPEEANLLDVNGIAGFVYLPLLKQADFLRLLAGVTTVRTPDFSLFGPVGGSPARATATTASEGEDLPAEAAGRC